MLVILYTHEKTVFQMGGCRVYQDNNVLMLLELFKQNKHIFLHRYVRMDETLIYYYTLESNQLGNQLSRKQYVKANPSV